MTVEEVIDLAYSEYSSMLKSGDSLEIIRGTDDGGKSLDFIVVGDENATLLRNALPNTYNGYRTVVVYSYEPEYELNDEEF